MIHCRTGIRSRDDWCAMLLVDARHARDQTRAAWISKWLRAHVRVYDKNYSALMQRMEQFYAANANI